MAGKISVGSVSVSVVPSTEGFSEDLDAKLKEPLHDRSVNVKVTADTAEADAKIDETKARADSLNKSAGGAGSGISLMAGGIAAALPLLPELTAGLVAASGAVFAAGAGLASFGAVALTDITNATNATQQLRQAQLAVQNATSNSARSDALTKEQALITSLGPSTIALGSAITGLDNAWKSFAAGFTPEITRDVESFSNILTTSFPLIQPLISSGARAVSEILNNLNTALEGPAVQQFFTWIAGAAETDILDLTKAFGGFGTGILELFKDFAPLETLVVNGLAGMGSAFSKWATNLPETQGFQQFLKYAAENGPLLVHTLEDVGAALAHILAALTPLLPPLLQLIDFFANIIKNVPGADLTVTAIALGGLFLLNKAVVTLTGSGLLGIPALLGFSGAEDKVGASGEAAAGKVGGLIGLLSKLGSISLPAILGGSAAAAGAIFGPALLTSGDSTSAPAGRYKNAAQSFLDANPITSGSSASDLAKAVTAEAYLSTGTVGKYLIPTQNGQSWANMGAGSLSQGLLSTWTSLYGTPDQQQQFAKLFGALPVDTSFNAINPQLTNTGQIGLRGNALTRADASDANINAIGYGSSFDPSAQPGGANGGTGLPPGYSIPNTASSAAATAAANNAAGIASLLGLNLMQSLAAGIATGTNPLTEAFTNINAKLTGPAQTLGTALQTIFTNALALGQQAAQSLAFSVTAAPTVGSYTSVYMDAQGRSTTTTQSPLVGSAFNALITDQKFVADLQKAAAMGLAPSLRAQFVAAGPSSFPTLDALVNSGAGAVSTLDSENAAITALGNSYGLQVATQQYGQQTVATLQQIRDQQAQLPAAIGTSVAAALNHTAGTAKVAANNTPQKGVFSRAH